MASTSAHPSEAHQAKWKSMAKRYKKPNYLGVVRQTHPDYREAGEAQDRGHKSGVHSMMKTALTKGWHSGLAQLGEPQGIRK